VKTNTLETWVWVLIYGGLLALVLGLFVQRTAAGFGWVLITGGAATAVVGFVLIYVRSRMKDK
jgi:hypothetical protein